jgi:hypothetical protein
MAPDFKRFRTKITAWQQHLMPFSVVIGESMASVATDHGLGSVGRKSLVGLSFYWC